MGETGIVITLMSRSRGILIWSGCLVMQGTWNQGVRRLWPVRSRIVAYVSSCEPRGQLGCGGVVAAVRRAGGHKAGIEQQAGKESDEPGDLVEQDPCGPHGGGRHEAHRHEQARHGRRDAQHERQEGPPVVPAIVPIGTEPCRAPLGCGRKQVVDVQLAIADEEIVADEHPGDGSHEHRVADEPLHEPLARVDEEPRPDQQAQHGGDQPSGREVDPPGCQVDEGVRGRDNVRRNIGGEGCNQEADLSE